jgi:hypothetical protein
MMPPPPTPVAALPVTVVKFNSKLPALLMPPPVLALPPRMKIPWTRSAAPAATLRIEPKAPAVGFALIAVFGPPRRAILLVPTIGSVALVRYVHFRASLTMALPTAFASAIADGSCVESHGTVMTGTALGVDCASASEAIAVNVVPASTAAAALTTFVANELIRLPRTNRTFSSRR